MKIPGAIWICRKRDLNKLTLYELEKSCPLDIIARSPCIMDGQPCDAVEVELKVTEEK